MGFSAALWGGAISGADAVPRAPGGAGGAAATRARRFRWVAGRARSLRRALRRCGAADAPLPARAWGVFSGRRVVWRELSVAPGRTARGGGGFSERWAAPMVFLWFLCPIRPIAVVARPDGSVARRKRAFRASRALGLGLGTLLSGNLVCALLAKRKPDNRPARRSVSNRISVNPQPCNRCSSSSHAAPPRCCRRLRGNTERAA